MSGEERSSPYKYILKKSIRQTSDENKEKYAVAPVFGGHPHEWRGHY